MEGVVAMPGAASLLTHLPGLAWAIVTSCSDALARARLEACGLPIPRVLIAAERIANGKPAPDGYLAGARALGIPPADCIVFEDAPPGITAGIGAGARVVALTTTFPQEQLTEATRIVRDLTEVRIGRDHGAQPGAGRSRRLSRPARQLTSTSVTRATPPFAAAASRLRGYA